MKRTIIFGIAICLCYSLFLNANAQMRRRQPEPQQKTSNPQKTLAEASCDGAFLQGTKLSEGGKHREAIEWFTKSINCNKHNTAEVSPVPYESA